MGVDRDLDGVQNGPDNCPAALNGPGGGSCTAGDPELLAMACTASAQCGTGGFCSLAQEDADLDTVGDACEPMLLPEPGSALLLGVGVLCLWSERRLRGDRSRSG